MTNIFKTEKLNKIACLIGTKWDLVMDENQKLLLKLSVPVFIELLLQILVGNIDQIMISSYSQTSVGAVQNANQILQIIIFVFNMINVAVTVLIAQYSGAGKNQRGHTIFTLGIILNCLFSVSISAVLLLFDQKIYELLQVPQALLGDLTIYFRIVGMFLILDAMLATFSAAFKATQIMKYSVIVNIVINILNIIGNAILINGLFGAPRWGVKGVAISTVVSRMIGIMLMLYFYKKKSTVFFSLKLLRPFPKNELKKILQIGLPGGGEALLYNVSQTVIMGMINTCGLAAINARTYVALIVRFSYLFALAIGIAGQTVIGINLGKGEYTKIEKTVVTTRRMAVATAMTMDVILFLIIGPILNVFHATNEVIVLSRIVLMVDFFLEFGKGNNIVMTRAMTAVGDVMYPMIVGIVFMWLAAVGLSYVFGIAMGYGLIGIWVAMTIDEWSRAFILNRRFKSGKWKTIWKVE